MTDYYRQCKLRRGNHIEYSWIPNKFGILGKVIKLERDGEWEDGWLVDDVYGRQTKKHIEAHERDYLYQRAASDI